MATLTELAKYDRKQQVRKTLEEGVDANEQDEEGQTALFIASSHNHTDLLAFLLSLNQLNINLQRKDGWTPFFSCCSNGSVQAVLSLIQDPRTNINQANAAGWTPLMGACFNAQMEVVKILLSFGRTIDLHKTSTIDFWGIRAGSKALDIAKKQKHNKLVLMLEEFKVSPLQSVQKARKELRFQGKKKTN